MIASVVRKAYRHVSVVGLLVPPALGLLCLGILTPTVFDPSNIAAVLLQSSIVGVMSLGMTFVLVSGRVDLSVGSLLSLATMVAIDVHDRAGPLAAVASALGVGLAVGATNAFLIAFLRLNSLIATLAMLSLLQGITMIYSSGQDLTIGSPSATWFRAIGRGQMLSVPVPVVIFALSALTAGVLLHATTYGRKLFAVGGNERASFHTGLRTGRVVTSVYLISGLATAAAALIMGSRVMGAQTNTGAGYEFDVIAAVALGGTSLMGGRGSIAGSVIGVVVLAFLQNGLLQLGLPFYTQWMITSLIIITSVWIDATAKRDRVLA